MPIRYFVLIGLLSGCASAPPAQIVKIPAAVACITRAPVRPIYEFEALTTTATDGQKILSLARDWPRGRAYEAALEATIAGCL